MSDLKSTIARHNRYQDSLVATFEAHLRDITLQAQARVIARLQAALGITDGVIDSTAGNMLLMRNAGKMFMQEMDKAGYQRLVDAFVSEFRGTLPFLQETLELLGEQVGQKWGMDLGFTARDFSLLGGVQGNAAAAIEGAIQATAGQAVTRGMFSVAGLRFGSLVEMLTERLGKSIAQASSIADTSMSIFYSTASDRAYQIIEKDLPEQVLKFRYSGPVDKLERRFCRHLTDVGKAYTREQIGQMDNGQLPNVFITRGGYRCRHQWNLDTHDLTLKVYLPQSEAA